MILPDGKGIVILERAGGPPRLVRAGDTIGEFTLRKIFLGSAMVVSRDGTETRLSVPKPGM
jgi:hypothetical protein